MIEPNKLCPGCMKESNGDRICEFCGYDILSKNGADVLSAKSVLSDRFIIGKIIERTSEGITYLALDTATGDTVNIKEYFPMGVSVRNPDKTVAASGNNSYYFNEGLIEFIELNRKLKEADAPSLIPINTVFEDNGTAYVIFSQIAGITLSDFLHRNGGMLKWEQARPLFLPLIDTVIALNDSGIIHGGISPESIIVGRDGKLRLSGISIIETRFASESFETGIYPGCAAIEQYSTEKGNIGSFTDVYGLSATLFRVLLGSLPPAANERINGDNMSIPSHFADELPRQVLVAIANGLQIKIDNRTVSTEKFRDELVYGETPENIRKAEAKRRQDKIAEERRISEKFENTRSPSSKSSKKKSKKNSSVRYALISALCTVVVFIVAAVILSFTVFKDYIFPKKDTKPRETASMPSIASVGEIEPGADKIEVTLYAVPNLKGKFYSELDDIEEFEPFKAEIIGKEYSDSIPRGTICKQSVKAGKKVERNTKISVTISLGPKSVKMPDVTNLTEDKAKLVLLRKGFLYENIDVIETYDENNKPKTIVGQTPESGESVSTEDKVIIRINTYEEKTASSDTEELFDEENENFDITEPQE